MTADNELTILLTLKDRAPFTFRWMSYINSINFPFKVLIADGGADETVPKVLSNKANFPNVTYEYVRYPYDQTYAEYYSKVVDALSRIKTPFVALADNDDCFIGEGLKLAAEFLRVHPDYSACGGHVGVFWVTSSDKFVPYNYNGAYGNKVELKWRCRPPSLIQETAAERTLNQFAHYFDASYYDVQRTEELKSRFDTLRALNIKDIFLAEYLLAILTGVAGKVQRIGRLYLVRQWNSPDSSGGTHQEKYGDALGRMFAESWSDDFTKFVNVVAAALVEKDGISIEDARDHVKKCYKTFVAPAIIECLVAEPTVTTTMPIIAHMVQRVVKLGPNSLMRKTLQKLYRRIPWISVSAINGEGLLTYPLSTYRDDFKPIAKLLTQKPPVFNL